MCSLLRDQTYVGFEIVLKSAKSVAKSQLNLALGMILPVTLLNLSLLKSQLQLVKISVQATAKTGAKFSGKLVVGGWWWGLRLIFQPACMILAKTCLTSSPRLCRKIQFARICSVFVNKICAGICRVVVCVFAASERMIRLGNSGQKV